MLKIDYRFDKMKAMFGKYLVSVIMYFW